MSFNIPAMVDAVQENPKWKPRARVLHVWMLDDGAFSAVEFCYMYRRVHYRIAKIRPHLASYAPKPFEALPETGGYGHPRGNRDVTPAGGRVAIRPATESDIAALVEFWHSKLPLTEWLKSVLDHEDLAKESKAMIERVIRAGGKATL